MFRRVPRRAQFRLRTLLLAVAVVSAPLGIWAHRERQFRIRCAAVDALTKPTPDGFVVVERLLPGCSDVLDPSHRSSVDYRRFPRALMRDDVVARVSIVNVPVSDEMVAAIELLPSLRSFSFTDSIVTERLLKAILNRPLVEAFEFKRTAVGDEIGPQLARLHSLRKLAHRGGLPAAALPHLSSLRELESLILGGNAINDESLRHLGALPKLTFLDIRGTPISDNGLAHLHGLASLDYLSLSHCAISDAGLVRLAPLTKLACLDLTATQVSDKGLSHLRRLTALRTLYLSQCAITDAGLMELAGMKALRCVDASGTQVTGDGAARLEALMPKLDVIWGE